MTNTELMLKTLPLFQDASTVQNLKNKTNISMKQVSDGHHTFSKLYEHRCKLSAIIFNLADNYAWKSLKHADNTMFENDFIVGVSIPDVGDYSYHYNLKYWDMFNVPIVENAPVYDGHTPEDIDRLFELVPLIQNTLK